MKSLLNRILAVPVERLEKISAAILLAYIAAYFTFPYKPWGWLISFHTPVLMAGLLVCALAVHGRASNAHSRLPPEMALFYVSVALFVFSAIVIHNGEFSSDVLVSYLVSFLGFHFVGVTVPKLDIRRLYLLMRLYLLVSGALILLQVHFAGAFYPPGFFGQGDAFPGGPGLGFASSPIFAGGAAAWMLSVLFAEYALPQKKKYDIGGDLFRLSAFGVGASGLFYTLNRGAWLAMALAVICLSGLVVLLRFPKKNLFKSLIVMSGSVILFHAVTSPKVVRLPAQLSFVAGILGGVSQGVIGGFSTDTDVSGILVNDPSTLTRFKSWELAVGEIASHPVWGIGLGQYPGVYEKSFREMYKGLPPERYDPVKNQTASNMFLYYAVESGILPAVFLFSAIGLIIARGLHAGASSGAFPLVIGALVICAWSMTSDYIAERIFWIAMGCVAGLVAKKPIRPELHQVDHG